MNNNPDLITRLTEDARILGEARMLRDEQPLTPELTAAVIARFQETLTRLGKSQEWAARSLGIAPSSLSQILGGSYGADVEKPIRAIDKWTESQIIKERSPRPAGFVHTTVAKQIYAAAKWAIESSCIVLVHGPAGIGKTMCAQAVRGETTGSVFISVRTAGQTATAVLDDLSQALRLAPQNTRAQTFNHIANSLRDTGRLIIVDEIHKLAGRRKDEALHCLRDLHDAAGVPMLWLGMTNIATYIQNGQASGYEPLDQIYSRIGLWLNFTEIAMGVDGDGSTLATVEDIQKLIAASKLRITPDGAAYLQALACVFGSGAFRTVTKLLLLAARFSDGKPLDGHMLAGIQKRRLGIKAAESLETQMYQLRQAKSA